MSTFKIVLIVAGIALFLFILLLVYTLSPTIRNVSGEPAFRHLLNKELVLQRPAFLLKQEKHQYEFRENGLTQVKDHPGALIRELQPGSGVIIREFKTYTSGTAGFTHLYALGETADNGISFEYSLGTVDKDLYGEEPYNLRLTIWQDSTEQPIMISK